MMKLQGCKSKKTRTHSLQALLMPKRKDKVLIGSIKQGKGSLVGESK